MTVINSNIAALNAQAAISGNSRGLEKSMQQLSTGKRINSAADDAAGIAIASRLTAQVRGLNQAIRNANDGISMLQTAEGATDAIGNMLQRMRELAVQAGNDTYNDDDRTSLATEFNALADEIDRVAATTQWNGFNVLDATGGTSGTFTFYVGGSDAADNQVDVVIEDFSTAGSVITSASGDLDNADASIAATVITALDTDIETVNTKRSEIGSYINRFQYTIDNLTNISANAAASRSRVEDIDYGQATTELAKRQILQQAATAMLAQANQQPQAVLSLLK